MKTNKYRILTYSLFTIIAAMATFDTMTAQVPEYRRPSWRYGISSGLQFNSASLGWQTLHGTDANFHSPENNIIRVDGSGMGFYGGIFGAYLPDSWWGIEMRISYDVRDALVEDITRKPVPSFDTKMDYLSFCPSIRIDQDFIPNLSVHFGPFVNVNLTGTYVYKPNITQSESEPSTDITRRNIATYGIAGGFAYDIMLAEISNTSSMFISPFVDCSWLVNQRKSEGEPSQNSITDIWSTLSYRAGIRLSLDYTEPEYMPTTEVTKLTGNNAAREAEDKKYKVSVLLPVDNVILTKNIVGYFPLHPYVFFDKENQEIPARYTLLSKAEAKDFNEADVGNFMKGDLSVKESNIDQLMKTYYNVLNIFGNRMRNNPNEKLLLRGSDPEEKEGEASALKVKSYLVNTFGINADRITIEVEPPFKPSGSDVTEQSSKSMIADENRRVKFVFSNQDMVKPVSYTIRDESSFDNDIIFKIGYEKPYKSWSIIIAGEGRSMLFGPFWYHSERINPSELIRFLDKGKYNARVLITDMEGKNTEQNFSFELVKEREIRNATRFLMIFDYNQSDAVWSYEKKIKNEIVPGIAPGNKVIIHGHTDIIGTQEGNQILSQARADQAKKIIDEELVKEDKNNTVQAFGVGQAIMGYTFNNNFPEGRMYNRNIFVEIIK